MYNFFPFRAKTAVLTDERIKVMNEIISGIRVIKMYTWEEPFAKLVADIRRLVLKVANYKINNMLQPTITAVLVGIHLLPYGPMKI